MASLNAKTLASNFQGQIANLLTSAWYLLRSPRLTGLLLVILALVLTLALFVSQRANPIVSDAAREAWVASLWPSLQPWGPLLFALGFSRLLDSPWFWLPMGLLLVNCLVALADYGPGSWRRVQPALPSLGWQHPLARRAEQSNRLPESPDVFLDELKATLMARNFYLYAPPADDPRLLGAAQHRWGWLGPLAFYSALLLLIIAIVISHTFLQVDTLTLRPFDPQTSPLFPGKFELTNVSPAGQTGQVTYSTEGNQATVLTWRLYLPEIFKNTLIWPRGMEPILTVEGRDETGAYLRLIPSQENLAPAEKLHLPLPGANTPVYFLIPATDLAFQITPRGANQQRFEVKVRHGAEAAPVEQIEARAGQAFEVGQVNVVINLNADMTVTAWRDPALPVYGVALALMVVAGVFTFWFSPVQVWFIPEVKGRGGQLYSVVETFGRVATLPPFLELILNREK